MEPLVVEQSSTGGEPSTYPHVEVCQEGEQPAFRMVHVLLEIKYRKSSKFRLSLCKIIFIAAGLRLLKSLGDLSAGQQLCYRCTELPCCLHCQSHAELYCVPTTIMLLIHHKRTGSRDLPGLCTSPSHRQAFLCSLSATKVDAKISHAIIHSPCPPLIYIRGSYDPDTFLSQILVPWSVSQ